MKRQSMPELNELVIATYRDLYRYADQAVYLKERTKRVLSILKDGGPGSRNLAIGLLETAVRYCEEKD
jgi:hypothetical protein